MEEGVIYLIKKDKLVEMTGKDYESEDLLQRTLAEHPHGNNHLFGSPAETFLVGKAYKDFH